VTGETAGGLIMALRHRSHPVEGVQFHPESILTDAGHQLLGNWLAGLRVPIHRGARLEPPGPPAAA